MIARAYINMKNKPCSRVERIRIRINLHTIRCYLEFRMQ